MRMLLLLPSAQSFRGSEHDRSKRWFDICCVSMTASQNEVRLEIGCGAAREAAAVADDKDCS